MYRGWPPNVLLVMPEKAIKLTMNDVFRSHLKRPDGTIGFGNQMVLFRLLCSAIFIFFFISSILTYPHPTYNLRRVCGCAPFN